MALNVGDTFGPYEITGLIGAGGMGEVYRGRDTRLDRTVAIKVLPDTFSADVERIARFEREAKTLASLNHTHVAQIYGLEEKNGRRALAMEYVDGEDLTSQISRGPLPLEDALAIAQQIADALDSAHQIGIIHRDLKPSNIRIREDGTVKVLDFGLAKAFDPASAAIDPLTSPTITSPAMTERGVILGTAAYMAPEQAKGRVADKRADIWAFGAVLYEMVTGRRAFQGESVSDTLASVLKSEPDWSRVPPRLHRLLRSCFEKDPRRRLRDIGDWWRLIDEGPEPGLAAPARTARLAWTVAGVALLLAGTLAVLQYRERAPSAMTLRFQVPAPPNTTLETGLALSPDGQRLAFTARDADGTVRVWVRDFDSLESRALAGTEGTRSVFWAPDGRSLGLISGRQLKRIAVAGGSPTVLHETANPAALGMGVWSTADVIVFGGTFSGPMRQIPAAGGVATLVTTIDQSRGELAHGLPSLLPDGRHFVYLRVSRSTEYAGLYLGSLDRKPEEQDLQRLISGDSRAVYEPTGAKAGRLLYLRQGTLMAQPFDVDRLALSGQAVPVVQDVGNQGALGFFSVSANGILAYRTGRTAPGGRLSQLTWLDRQGTPVNPVGDPGTYWGFALSPDGKRAIVADASITNPDLWHLDLARGVSTRFTSGPSTDREAVWASDGRRVAYRSVSGKDVALFVKDTDGAGREDMLIKSEQVMTPTDWSRDGRFLLYHANDPQTRMDIWALPVSGDRQPIPILRTAFDEGGARFSSDMRSIVYTSNESGRDEVYVRPFDPSAPGSSASGYSRVSKDGGESARWRRDGRELVFREPTGGLMAATFAPGPRPLIGTPRRLFALASDSGQLWDFTSDGTRFLVAVPVDRFGAAPISVVMPPRQ